MFTIGGGLWASSGQRPEILLSVRQHTRQPCSKASSGPEGPSAEAAATLGPRAATLEGTWQSPRRLHRERPLPTLVTVAEGIYHPGPIQPRPGPEAF